jgi:hypothetical protein
MDRMQCLFLLLAGSQGIVHGQSPYLPLQEGARWTLTNPASPKALDIEVLARQGAAYHVRFASPFGTNEWMLEPRGEKYVMTKFGAKGQFMDVPDSAVYFDFGVQVGGVWSNLIGKMSVLSRDGDRVSIQQDSKGGKIIFTFERGKGFVQFGDGKTAFVLNEGRSSLPQGTARPSGASGGTHGGTAVDDTEPVSHVPTPARSAPSASSRPTPSAGSVSGRVLFSITPNAFANESQDPQTVLSRFNQVAETGMGFLVHNAKWNELEPKKGRYSLDALNFNVFTAKRLNVPMTYTFRLIETVDRSMPQDLERLRWTDPRVEERLMAVLETIVPRFEGTVRWFMLGNEIDGYFGRHPNEVNDFAQLLAKAKRKIQSLDPSIRVASTLMFGGIRTLEGDLRPLDEQFDFLCFTYYPIRGDFTMKDPDIVTNDVGLMRKYARGRKVVLQEIGYPSGGRNGSDQDKQARFVSNVFRELRANNDMVEAGCFWPLADLKDEFVKSLSGYYGIHNSDTFNSFLQTMGMFDGNGRPKKAWTVYQQEVRR